MPIKVHAETRRLDQEEFGEIAYDVMRCVFNIHNEYGRFFEEKIYKRELARRLPDLQLEVPLEVSFDGFQKLYFLDCLASGGAVFEFKAAETLVDRHRSQLLHYLLLAELPHGKLVNIRTERVQHEFMNTTLRRSDRIGFDICDAGWNELGESDLKIRIWFSEFLRDIGACLDVSLYEEAITNLLSRSSEVIKDIQIMAAGTVLGTQKFRIVEPGVAFKVTSLGKNLRQFETQTRRLLEHTALDAIQWINVTRDLVIFKTLYSHAE